MQQRHAAHARFKLSPEGGARTLPGVQGLALQFVVMHHTLDDDGHQQPQGAGHPERACGNGGVAHARLRLLKKLCTKFSGLDASLRDGLTELERVHQQVGQQCSAKGVDGINGRHGGCRDAA